MFRILHIYAGQINRVSGVVTVLKNLILQQNQLHNTKAFLLLLEEKYEDQNLDLEKYIIKKTRKQFYRYVSSENYDVYIFHGVYFKEYLRLYRILLKQNKKYIIKTHGTLMKTAQNIKKTKKKLANFVFFDNFIKSSNSISYLSTEELLNSKKYGKKHFVIPNGVNFQNNTLHYKEGLVRYMFLGRIKYYQKGLDRLILLAKMNQQEESSKKIQFDIYGSGKKRDVLLLNKRIEKEKIDNVKFHGPKIGQELTKIFEEHDIMILPSRSEGQPMVLLEGFSFGLPCVISSDLINIAETVKKNHLGWLFSDGDYTVIHRSFIEFNKNPSFYFQKTKSYVLKNHDWIEIAKKSVLEYKKAIC